MNLRQYLSIVFIAAFVSLLPPGPAFAIIGGDAVESDEGSSPASQSLYPWNALLHFSSEQSGNSVCGATLVGARFVITSAHCLNGYTDPSGMYVTVGGYDRTNGQETGQTIAVSSFIVNPNFPAPADQNIGGHLNLPNDMAILILAEDAARVETPVYVTQTEIEPGVTATILGWGATAYEELPGTEAILREAQVGTVSYDSCYNTMKDYGTVNATMICAGVASGAQDACGADSGGPLFVVGRDGKPVQIGIVSWGKGCGEAGFPGVYTNLAEMLGFILDTLGGQTYANLVDYALTGDQQKVAEIFDQIGPAAAAGSEVRQDYGRLFMNGVYGTSVALQSLLPASAFEMGAAVANFVSMESLNLKARLRSLREGVSGGLLDISGLRLSHFASQGNVDPSTNLSASAAPGRYDPSPAGDVSGGIGGIDLTSAGQASPNAGRMYSPSLYSENVGSQGAGTASTLRNVDTPSYATGVTGYDAYGRPVNTGTTSTLRNVDTSSYPTVNPPVVTGYDAYGNPIRTTSIPAGYVEQGAYYGRILSGAQAPAKTATSGQDEEGVLGWVSGLFDSAEDVADKPSRPTTRPRTAALTNRDQAYRNAARYPGQPLGMYARYLANTAATEKTKAPNAVRLPLANQYAVAGTDPSGMYQWVSTMPEQTAAPTTITTPSGQVPARLGTVAVPYSRPTAINADRRWGVFMAGDVRFGNEKLMRNGPSTKMDNTGFSIGLDYRVEDKSFIGVALSYAHGSFNTGDYSDVQGDGYAVSLYGTTSFLKDAYADGFISLGYHTFDSERTLFIGNGQTRTASAEPDAIHFSGEVETGYNFKQDNWKYGPYAGMRLSYASFDKYTESGGGSFDLNVRNRDDVSAIGSLGFGGSRRFYLPTGGVVLPAMRVAFNHEFGDGQSNVKSAFVTAPTRTFKTEGAVRERNWISVSPSVAAALPNNWLFQANYEHDFFRYNVNDHIFNLAARYKW